MQSRADFILKALLSHSDKTKALERFLPLNIQKELEGLPTLEEEIDIEPFYHDHSLFEKVHWSWFLPTLKLYPESEQKLFLSALNPQAEKNLAKALTLSVGQSEITEIGKSFVQKILLDNLIGSEDRLLPTRYLPASPMNRLLHLTKVELIYLIDRLAMYDLSLELRQIVETKILKKIYSLITADEKKTLQTLSGHKEPFSLGKLGLDRWDGSEEALRTLLHKRGLVRLGAGLSGQDPDLIWYICHQLDIGRGSQLHKQCMNEPIHGVTDVIMKQIEEQL